MSANLAWLFAGQAARRPEQAILVDGECRLTRTALLRRAARIAAELTDGGIGPGSQVAIRIESPLELTVAVLGALAAGAAVTPLNPRLAADEREATLADLQPVLTLSQTVPGEAEFDPRAVAAETPAFVLYTSGSTGQPKGVVLSHGAVAAALAHWRGPVMALGEDDVVLSTLPPAHSFGLFGSILAPLSAGATVVFLDRFTPEAALAAIPRHRVSVFPGVATMFQRVLECPELAASDLTSLRIAVSGAAPCPWELAEKWRAATGARIIRGYGMTELFRPISFSAGDDSEAPLAIGRAMPGVRLRIVDDNGEELATGETGELWINSPARLTEYLNRPQETAEVLADGWFRTGDLATVSADGFVTIAGRIKDVILRGGYTVAAGEIEAALQTHGDIAEAAVVGVPDPELGEEIAAFVTLCPGAAVTEADIVAHCRRRLASYKYPRRIEIVESLPKGPTGKILKARLQA